MPPTDFTAIRQRWIADLVEMPPFSSLIPPPSSLKGSIMPNDAPAFPDSLFLGKLRITIEAPALAADERYAGILTARNQLYHLILLPGEFTDNWNAAMRRAQSLDADLPSPLEQKLLFVNVDDAFKNDWYWSNEQYRAYSVYAWVQHFGNGLQSTCHKDNELPVRLVRREVIR